MPQRIQQFRAHARRQPLRMIDGRHPIQNHIRPPQIPLQTRVNPRPHIRDFLLIARAIGPIVQRLLEKRQPHIVLFQARALRIGRQQVVRATHGDFEAEIAETPAQRQFGRKENRKGWVLF